MRQAGTVQAFASFSKCVNALRAVCKAICSCVLEKQCHYPGANHNLPLNFSCICAALCFCLNDRACTACMMKLSVAFAHL